MQMLGPKRFGTEPGKVPDSSAPLLQKILMVPQ